MDVNFIMCSILYHTLKPFCAFVVLCERSGEGGTIGASKYAAGKKERLQMEQYLARPSSTLLLKPQNIGFPPVSKGICKREYLRLEHVETGFHI